MSARDDLARAFRAAISLTRHDMSEKPSGPEQEVAIVQLPGGGPMKPAIWHNGEWLNEKRKPFPVAPLCWFSVEVRK